MNLLMKVTDSDKLVEHWLGPRVGSVVALFRAAQSKLRVIRVLELAMVAHSLVPLSPAAHAARLSSPSPRSLPQAPPVVLAVPPINRRTILVGLGGALWSWNALAAKEEAMAAARRPPPPPPKEKKDPTVTGVQAKVLASKKRKEEMKASIAKLREKGKPVVEAKPSSSSSE
jgi:hypothetical protein